MYTTIILVAVIGFSQVVSSFKLETIGCLFGSEDELPIRVFHPPIHWDIFWVVPGPSKNDHKHHHLCCR